jgi:mono/diheme cytochrome c family protein
LLSVLILSTVAAPSQGTQQQAPAASPAAPAAIPPEALNQVNPVKPTGESLARAKKIYGYDCAMCHGVDGSGNGDLAKDMKLKMADYRDPATLKGKTDGELFYIIKNGEGQMPGEGERAKPDETWNLVLYLRSFAKQ